MDHSASVEMDRVGARRTDIGLDMGGRFGYTCIWTGAHRLSANKSLQRPSVRAKRGVKARTPSSCIEEVKTRRMFVSGVLRANN
jgi:hypothetical protein